MVPAKKLQFCRNLRAHSFKNVASSLSASCRSRSTPRRSPCIPRCWEERCGSGFSLDRLGTLSCAEGQPRSDGAGGGVICSAGGGQVHKGVTPRRDRVVNVAGLRGRGSGISHQHSAVSLQLSALSLFPFATDNLYETSCRQGVLSFSKPSTSGGGHGGIRPNQRSLSSPPLAGGEKGEGDSSGRCHPPPHLPPSKGGGPISVMLRRPLGGGFLRPPALRMEYH